MTGLQCARLMWRRRIPVIGAANDPRSPYCRTRSLREIMPFAVLASRIRPVLQEIVAAHGARPVVMACTDEHVWWLNDHREEFEAHADLLLAPSDVLQLLADKARLYRYAMEHRLALPDTCFVRTPEELEQAARTMRFPVVIKPPRRSPEWMRATEGRKVVRVDNAETLLRKAPRLQSVAGELILQTWVKGPDVNMHSLYVCLDRDSKPLATMVVKKIRQWPPDTGVGCLAVETRSEEVTRTGLDILQRLGFVGIGSFQFKKDDDTGNFYMIEMNTGRAALNMPVCELCGVEMIHSYYCAAAGLPLPESRTVTRPGGKWICWKTDLASAYVHWRRGDLTVREWIASLRGHKWSADIQADDLGPFFADLIGKLARGFRQRSS